MFPSNNKVVRLEARQSGSKKKEKNPVVIYFLMCVKMLATGSPAVWTASRFILFRRLLSIRALDLSADFEEPTFLIHFARLCSSLIHLQPFKRSKQVVNTLDKYTKVEEINGSLSYSRNSVLNLATTKKHGYCQIQNYAAGGS